MQSEEVSHLRIDDEGCARLSHVTMEDTGKKLEVQSVQNKIEEHR
jgi:hypothetical protein